MASSRGMIYLYAWAPIELRMTSSITHMSQKATLLNDRPKQNAPTHVYIRDMENLPRLDLYLAPHTVVEQCKKKNGRWKTTMSYHDA